MVKMSHDHKIMAHNITIERKSSKITFDTRLIPPNNTHKKVHLSLKQRCDERFTQALTAYSCVFKEITLVGSNQGNYFENENACSKRTLKTTVATQLTLCLSP